MYFIQKKIKKQKTIVNKETIIKDNSSSLKRKLSLIKESHRRGFIREKTYHKTKLKLEKLIKKSKLVK